MNDYEGIAGYEEYRDDLALAYLAALDPSNGRLVRLEMGPFQIRRFRLNRAVDEDSRWLRDTLDRECHKLGSGVELTEEGTLRACEFIEFRRLGRGEIVAHGEKMPREY